MNWNEWLEELFAVYGMTPQRPDVYAIQSREARLDAWIHYKHCQIKSHKQKHKLDYDIETDLCDEIGEL